MNNAHKKITLSRLALLALLLLLYTVPIGALADGLLPMMPAPPDVPVYWQLASVEREPAANPAGGYQVLYNITGDWPDLSDRLMAESLQDAEEAVQPSLQYTLDKDGTKLSHTYTWTKMPIYMEPGTSYPIDIAGTENAGTATLSSILSVHLQHDRIARISAGGYSDNLTAATITLDPSKTQLYADGSLVISFNLRDVNDMFTAKVTYTYEMIGGDRPYPTPVPGFVAAPIGDAAVPSFYDLVPGRDDLWVITTAPDQYRAFGFMTGVGPMFFPSDAQGNVRMDEPAAVAELDYQNFVEGFVPVEPKELPALYSAVAPGVYGFTDREGNTVTRAYGRVDGGAAAFYPADATGIVADGAQQTDADADFAALVEGFGKAVPDAVPSYYIQNGDVFAVTDLHDNQIHYRVYGRLNGAEPAFYPADAEGNLLENAAATTPDADFDAFLKGFFPVIPAEVPAHYTQIGDAAFTIDDRDDSTLGRVYGRLDGAEPAYYAADPATGAVLDAKPIDPAADYEKYIAGFEPTEGADAPLYYQESGVPSVWMFTDTDGNTQYRIVGSLNRGEEAFYPCDAEGNVARDALPVLPESDLLIMPPPSLVPRTPDAAPSYYQKVEGKEGLYTLLDREGKPLYRVYGAYGRGAPQFYPADADGNAVQDAPAVDPAQDFTDYVQGFDATPAQDAPAIYQVVPEAEGLYSFETREGEPVYRVYGAWDRGEAGFYPADETGAVTEGAQPADPNRDFAEHFAGFDLLAPENVPPYYAPVDPDKQLYALTDPQSGEIIYRVYGAQDRGEPAFYPADESGNIIEGAQPVDPKQDFEERIAGFSPVLPDAVPTHYTIVDPEKSLYAFENKEGEKIYRVFGTLNHGETGFFPADENGNAVDGPVVDPQDDVALLPTPYSVRVSTLTPETGGPDQLGRSYTQMPYAEDPAPTGYSASLGQTGAPSDDPAQIGRAMGPYAEPTPYGASVVQAQATDASGNPIGRTIDPPATDYSGQVTAGADATDAIAAISRTVDAQVTDAPKSTATDNPQQSAAIITEAPNGVATGNPTGMPTDKPTGLPTDKPTDVPTDKPTDVPTDVPSENPTKQPEPTLPLIVLDPDPTETPAQTEAPEVAEQKDGLGIVWILMGAATVVLAFAFIIFKRKK